MCGRKLKTSLQLSVLFLVSLFLLSSSFCYAEIKLTDAEAMEILNEIQQSKVELNQVKTELTESKKESQELKMELEAVNSIYNEQKIYYEKQLNEVNEKNSELKNAVTVTGASTALLLTLLIAFLVIVI